MSKSGKHVAQVYLSRDQYVLVRERMHSDRLNWNTLLSTLVNAYVLGDIKVHRNGQYHLGTPREGIPSIQLKDSDEATLFYEPELRVVDSRRKSPVGKPKPTTSGWGTRQLVNHVAETTGVWMNQTVMYRLLRGLLPEHPHRKRYRFSGATDPIVKEMINLVEEGIYHEVLREGFRALDEWKKRKVETLKEAARIRDEEQERTLEEAFQTIEESP